MGFSDWTDEDRWEARRLGDERAQRQSDRLTPGVTRARGAVSGLGFRFDILPTAESKPDPCDILDDRPPLVTGTRIGWTFHGGPDVFQTWSTPNAMVVSPSFQRSLQGVVTAASRAMQAFEDSIDRVAQTFAKTGDDVGKLRSQLFDLCHQTGLAPDDIARVMVKPDQDIPPSVDVTKLDLLPNDHPFVNRKRHGQASICPRHGTTKGGLCRKCHR